MKPRVILESLESRTLMSGTSAAIPGPVFSAAVLSDKAHIQSDLMSFESDFVTKTVTLLNDVNTIKLDAPSLVPSLTPLIVKMQNDIHAMQQLLITEPLTDGSTVVADRAAVLTDLTGGAGRQQLLSDRIKLQNDTVAELDARITIRQNAFPGILADGDAIVAVVKASPSVSTKLQADVSKWAADRAGTVVVMSTDLQKLAGDRAQLVVDFTAMQNS